MVGHVLRHNKTLGTRRIFCGLVGGGSSRGFLIKVGPNGALRSAGVGSDSRTPPHTHPAPPRPHRQRRGCAPIHPPPAPPLRSCASSPRVGPRAQRWPPCASALCPAPTFHLAPRASRRPQSKGCVLICAITGILLWGGSFYWLYFASISVYGAAPLPLLSSTPAARPPETWPPTARWDVATANPKILISQPTKGYVWESISKNATKFCDNKTKFLPSSCHANTGGAQATAAPCCRQPVPPSRSHDRMIARRAPRPNRQPRRPLARPLPLPLLTAPTARWQTSSTRRTTPSASATCATAIPMTASTRSATWRPT